MRIPELVVKRFAGHQTFPHQLVSMPRFIDDCSQLSVLNNPLACEVDAMGLE
ncbi:hypothetical protein UCMB321_0336 [Pseudomonas batumici]|uniref:Uncharacterized protein n=1 Tax=Pseudomonas batumici TaxID=226910 RepID=A0A0C2EIT3_9PSED|nr:hypothetical protein UCMB321_0336 [Pseudomonas batumici]